MRSLSPSLPALMAMVGMSLAPACNPSSKYEGPVPYEPTSMGDTECARIYDGESTEEEQLSGIFVFGKWANERVQEVLNVEGVTVKIYPEDHSPLNCYGGEGVIPQEDGSLRFNFSSPVTNYGEVWLVDIAYPDAVYDTYSNGYIDSEGKKFENWELACFDQNSDSRPKDNYGYVFDETPNAAGEHLTVPGADEGWDCYLRFVP